MGQKVKPIANYQLLIPFIKKALGISLGVLCFGVRSGKPKKPQLIPGCRFLMSVDVSSQDSFIFPPSRLNPHNTNFAGASQWKQPSYKLELRARSQEERGRRKKEGRNQKKCFYKYEMIPTSPLSADTSNTTSLNQQRHHRSRAISHHKDREVRNSPILQKHPGSAIPRAIERPR